MYAYHVKSRGWCDIGYNFLVDRFGRAFEGRYGGTQLPVLGAHTGAYNANSFGVSLIGNFEKAAPSRAMLEIDGPDHRLEAGRQLPLAARATVVLAGSRLHSVSGHRDTKATACPGNNLYQELGWLRQRVNTLMGKASSTEIYRYAQTLGGFTKIGQPFWGEHRTGRAGPRTSAPVTSTGPLPPAPIRSSAGFRARYRQLGPRRCARPARPGSTATARSPGVVCSGSATARSTGRRQPARNRCTA